MGKFHNTEQILQLMNKIEQIRNVAFAGHIDHGKTTLSDSLLAEAGLLSESLAGEARALDYLEEEQRRGITMKAANVSLYYENSLENQEPFLINLVDTPGHLDFTGKVTRALRLVDGVLVIVDAVEEINAQSETVLRQALQEGVRPILFINKIDRLIRELKLTPQDIEAKFYRIVNTFNTLIQRFADEETKQKWLLSVPDGSVIFGSALHRWGFTLEKLKKIGWNFYNIYQKYNENQFTELVSILPVWEVVLAMIIKHIPNPKDAQSYRIKKIWTGDLTGKIGREMTLCNPKGPLVMCMSNIKYDSHGLIATGRIFSGTLRKGDKVFLVDANESERVMKVAIYMGSRMDNAESIPAGNIAAISGLKAVKSGETIVDEKISDSMVSFENVKYVSEPVVTVSVEPEKLKDLDILHEFLNQAVIEDPNLRFLVSNETGEVLLSGLGPLHLEVVCKEIEKKGLKLIMSRPMAVFRESIVRPSRPITFKNIDNVGEITLKIERNDLKTVQFLNTIKLSAFANFTSIIQSIIAKTSLSKEEAEGFMFLDEFGNFITNKVENLEIEKYHGKKAEFQRKKIEEKRKDNDKTLFLKESTIEDLFHAMRSIFISGPLVGERIAELKITILDLKLPNLEESNFIDLIPLFRKAIYNTLLETGIVLLEPIYQLSVQIPNNMIGNVTALLSQYQARIQAINQLEYGSEINALISVREYINFSEEIRSVSSGRAFWQAQFHSYEPVPENKKEFILRELKLKKGLMR